MRGGYVLAATSASHLFNHLSITVMSFLIPVIVAKELGLNTVQVGLLSASVQLTAGASQMFFGALGNVMKKSTVFSIGNALQAASGLIATVARGFLDILALRVLWGIGSAPQHPVGSSMISESFGEKRRGFALSIHMGIAYIGNMIGPIVATYLSSVIGWRLAFVVVGIPQFLLSMVFFLLARADQGPSRDGYNGATRIGSIKGSIIRSLKSRNNLMVNVAQALIMAARGLNLWITYLPIYLISVHAYDAGTSAAIVSIFLASGSIGTIFFGWAGQRLNKMTLAATSTVITSASLIYLSVFGASGYMLIAIIAALGFVSLEIVVALQSYLGGITDNSLRDASFGIFFTVGFLAASFWTAFVGYLIQASGFGLAFLFMGLINLPAALIMLILRTRSP
ncbi:MAG: MFS transporter [Aigarchaeota archaeon]|nr:MFS transporter [Aigarchaeota archaeon]